MLPPETVCVNSVAPETVLKQSVSTVLHFKPSVSTVLHLKQPVSTVLHLKWSASTELHLKQSVSTVLQLKWSVALCLHPVFVNITLSWCQQSLSYNSSCLAFKAWIIDASQLHYSASVIWTYEVPIHCIMPFGQKHNLPFYWFCKDQQPSINIQFNPLSLK